MKKNIVILLVSLMYIFLTGCSGVKYSFPDPATPPSDSAFASNPGKFETGGAEYEADFGTVTVPENRDSPGSRLIHLPVIRIHARSASPREPIFYLAGGPGQSNISHTPLDTLLSNHDFIMVGYRGVDGSVKLDCPEVAEVIEENNDLLGEESLKRIGKAWEESGRRFVREGIDWNGYTIPQVVEDMETVRKVLKYHQINIQSESYGSRVAYIYGLMHPESIHRTIMIGAAPPGRFMWDPKMVDEQLNNYARLWSKDSAMSARCPDLTGAIRRAMQNMPKRYLYFSLNPGKIKVTVFCLLFNRNSAALVLDAFVKADEGDYSGLALLSMAFDYVIPSIFVWGDLASKAVSADFDSSRIAATCTEDTSSILGSPLNKLLWKPLLYGQLPVQPIPEELRVLRHSEVETLILSGSLDFSAPPKYATNEFLPYLKNGRQIVLSEFGHVGDLIYLRRQSTGQIMASYYSTGIPDTSGLEYVPMNFEVNWSLPTIMKGGMAAGTLILLGLTAGAVLLARKVF